jgi:hypothetical protein
MHCEEVDNIGRNEALGAPTPVSCPISLRALQKRQFGA